MLHAAHMEHFRSDGFGGEKVIVSSDDGPDRYLVKIQKQNQSVTEYAAQSLLRAMGYQTPDARLIRIDDYDSDLPCNVFGGIEFLTNAAPFRLKDRTIGACPTKKLLYELILMNSILENVDECALMQDESIGIFMVDLGECALLNPPILPWARKIISAASVDASLWQGRKACFFYSADESEENTGSILDAESNVLQRISSLNFNNMRFFFSELKMAYGMDWADYYRMVLRKLRNACRLKLKYAPV